MHKWRRHWISEVEERLRGMQEEDIENYDEDKLTEFLAKLEEEKSTLETIKEEEEESYESTPESFENKRSIMEEAIDNLDNAISSLDDSIESVKVFWEEKDEEVDFDSVKSSIEEAADYASSAQDN